MFNTFADWMDHARESLLDSITCMDVLPDPCEVVQEAERKLIEATGLNLNGMESNES